MEGKHKDKMAGIIMATDVGPSSFINKEDFGDNSPTKDTQCEEGQGVASPEVDRLQSYAELNKESEKLDEISKGDVKLNLSVDTEVCHRAQQPMMISKSSGSSLEIRERTEEVEGHSDTRNEATGSSFSHVEQREQEGDNKKMPIDPTKTETDFLEDMRIFEANAAASGQARGPMEWILKQIAQDTDPRVIIAQLMPGAVVPSHIDDITLWKGVWELITEPKARKKLDSVNTLEDVVNLIQNSRKIIVLTGAGVSVSCGIPDFRSRDGIYARLSKDFPDLPDPQSMFDIHYFRWDQRPFFKFAKEIYPGQFVPSLSHRFIAALDRKDKLLRNYTQNIDTLEQVAGIQRVIQCHGSFATASCTKCKHKVDAEVIRGDVFNQVVPKCPICPQDESTLAVMKPDIIFFGEGLPDTFYQNLDTDKHEADLLIVIGSSLKVRPVALIPDYVKHDIPQILINREPLHHFNFDIELLGNCDAIICELCRRLGDEWEGIVGDYEMPLLGKETVEKLFESSSECDSDESDDIGERRSIVNEREDDGGLRHEKKPSLLNSETKSQSCGSVPVNLDHVLCEASHESDSVLGINENTKESRKEMMEKCSTENDSTQATPQEFFSERDSLVSHTAAECSSRDAIHGQAHNAIGTHPNNSNENLSHNSSKDQSHDALEIQCSEKKSAQSPLVDDEPSQVSVSSPSVTPVISHSSCGAVEKNFVGPARPSCQDSITSEANHTTSVDRKRIIDEVSKKCADCENGKVHERSEFSSEARLVQTSHNDFCKCGTSSKRKKLDSSSSVDAKEDMKNQRTVGPSINLHKVSSPMASSHSALPGRKSKLEIRGNSPSLDKADVMEKFDLQDIFYLFVPPNRYIFHGAELDAGMKFQHQVCSSSSEDESEVDTKVHTTQKESP